MIEWKGSILGSGLLSTSSDRVGSKSVCCLIESKESILGGGLRSKSSVGTKLEVGVGCAAWCRLNRLDLKLGIT